MADRVYDFVVKNGEGIDLPLSTYSGKVLLIVNVASKCGFTPQYEGLEALYKKYKDRGFEILGFPCNQFAGQEPGNAEEIKSFCSLKYGVDFPLFSKVDVNGKKADPLFAFLRSKTPGVLGDKVKWNFTKFLVDREGGVVSRFSPKTQPSDLAAEIERLLG